jgi:hypothetical protein
MKGRNPTKQEKEWMDMISQIGCVVCKKFLDCFSPAEVHHIDGKTKPEAHLKTIPLCYRHHRDGANNETYVSRHPFKNDFINRYGSEESLLEYTINEMLAL